MKLYLNIAQLIISALLIMVVLLQVKGGGLGGIFGQPDSVYRTRRGVEKTLFQFTILLIIIFIVMAIFSVRLGSPVS